MPLSENLKFSLIYLTMGTALLLLLITYVMCREHRKRKLEDSKRYRGPAVVVEFED